MCVFPRLTGLYSNFLSTVAAISFFPPGDGLFSNNIYWRPYLYLLLLVSIHCWWYICTFLPGLTYIPMRLTLEATPSFVFLLHTGLRFRLRYYGGPPSVFCYWLVLLNPLLRLHPYLSTANWPLLNLFLSSFKPISVSFCYWLTSNPMRFFLEAIPVYLYLSAVASLYRYHLYQLVR